MEILQNLQTLPPSLFVLVGILVLAVSLAGYALASGRKRQQVLSRADGRTITVDAASIFVDDRSGFFERMGRRLRAVVPRSLTASRETAGKLVRAGFDGVEAPVIFGAAQLTTTFGFPLLAFAFLPRTN